MSDNENTADIVTRLRDWRSLHLTRLGGLFDEAAAEIDRLRSQPCPYVTGGVTRYCTLTPFTLTDAEREAVDEAADTSDDAAAFYSGKDHARADAAAKHAATLRGLLERLT